MRDDPRLGTVLAGKYRLEELLGRGGMGAVYRARHLAVRKDFAVKLLAQDLRAQDSTASRFFLEAQAAGRVGHPGILEVYDVGDDEKGGPFIVMELLTGEPLSALIRRGPLPVDAACWVAMQVLDVLAAAHGAGIVHRDIKPQNVFLTVGRPPSGIAEAEPSRSVKLLDFGIAKFSDHDAGALTRSGEIIGSPLYMAPEQARSDDAIDARADIWSVGAMLFEMLTGTCIHAGTSTVAVLVKILTERAPLPSTRRAEVSPELDAIVSRALEIDRSARWPSARSMHDALVALRTHIGTAGALPSLPSPQPRTIATEASPAEAFPTNALAPTVLEPSSEGAPPSAARANGARSAWQVGRAAVGLGSLAAGAAVVLLTRGAWQRPRAAESAPTASAPIASSVTPVMPAARAEEPAPVEDASTFPVDVPQARAVASSAPSPQKPLVRCAPHEVLSNGHCCPRGQIWQDARCERPLAKTF